MDEFESRGVGVNAESGGGVGTDFGITRKEASENPAVGGNEARKEAEIETSAEKGAVGKGVGGGDVG